MTKPKLLMSLLIFISLGFDSFCQMEEGFYPYQIVDTLIFPADSNLFQIDTSTKPENFISNMEVYYLRSIMLNLREYNWKSEIIDSNSIKITLPQKNPELVNEIKIANEIHTKTNSRSFIAGVSNYSNDTISFPIQDESIIAIIEAREGNEWKPVEYWPISGCGNSFYSKYVLPGQTILITVNNYFGNNQALLRIRLHGNDTVFISKPFEGRIDNSKFKIPKNAIENHRAIMCDSIFFLKNPYFKDLNKELEFSGFVED